MKKKVSSLVLVGFLATSAHAIAQEQSTDKGLALVFDPLTKKYFTGGTSKFTLKQGDDAGLVERIDVSLDGGEYKTYNGSLQFANEGKHTLKFRAVNPVNNWSPVQFIELFVDMTPPTTEAKFLDDRSYKDASGTYIAQGSTVSLVSQDNLSGVASIEYSWDGKQFTPYTQPIPVEKPGKQLLYFHATDRVGNVEPVKKVEVFADGSRPVTTLKLSSSKQAIINGKTFLSDGVAYSLEATDDGSKVSQTWISVDGKPMTVYIKPFYLLQEGPHTLTYYSVDNVGNQENEKTLSVYTVSTPPRTFATASGKIVNTGGINYATKDFQLKLDAKDNVVGLERIEVKTDDDADFKPYLEPVELKTTGFHTISYHSVDRAGNIEPTKVFTVNIHEDAPETTIATAQPTVVRNGITYSAAPNVLTFNISNSSVGVEKTLVSINDAPFVPYQGPITLNTDRKVYKITYKSLDKLGNEETPKTVSYHMVGTAPAVDLFITNGQSNEEQVRTTYLEQPGNKATTPDATTTTNRSPASTEKPRPTP
jgi:hypothetical protein